MAAWILEHLIGTQHTRHSTPDRKWKDAPSVSWGLKKDPDGLKKDPDGLEEDPNRDGLMTAVQHGLLGPIYRLRSIHVASGMKRVHTWS
jgi:hypothetical protein